MQARIRLASSRVLLFSGREGPTSTAGIHQQDVYSRAIEGLVSPGESTCAIDSMGVKIEPPAVAAADKMQFFW